MFTFNITDLELLQPLKLQTLTKRGIKNEESGFFYNWD